MGKVFNSKATCNNSYTRTKGEPQYLFGALAQLQRTKQFNKKKQNDTRYYQHSMIPVCWFLFHSLFHRHYDLLFSFINSTTREQIQKILVRGGVF